MLQLSYVLACCVIELAQAHSITGLIRVHSFIIIFFIFNIPPHILFFFFLFFFKLLLLFFSVLIIASRPGSTLF